jgi:hypothetical protein
MDIRRLNVHADVHSYHVDFLALPRVQPELAGHLHVCVGESVALARVDPGLQSGMEWLGCAHVTTLRGGTTNV